MAGPGADDLLDFINKPANREILQVLAQSCSYTREIAQILGRDESDVSRRLKRALDLGLVEASTKTLKIGGRRVTVKQYCLRVRSIIIDLASGQVLTGPGEQESARPLSPPRPVAASLLIGRDVELNRVLNALVDGAGVVMVHGPPMSGKTALVGHAVSRAGRPVVWVSTPPSGGIERFSRLLALRLRGMGLRIDPDSFNADTDRVLVRDALHKAGAVLVVDDAHYAWSDRDVRRLVAYLAGEAYSHDYTVVLASRSRLEGVPVWEKGFVEVELGPVTPRAWAAIASLYADREVTEEEARRVQELLPLIPGYARIYAGLLSRTRDPEAAARALHAMATKSLASMLLTTAADRRIVAILYAAGGALPEEGLCAALRALSRHHGRDVDCKPRLRELQMLGVVRRTGDIVYLDEYYEGLARHVAETMERRLQREIGAVLVGGSDYYWRIEGVRLLAEACDTRKIARLVAERLERGDYWPFAAAHKYVAALERALECPSGEAAAAIIRAEQALIGKGLESPRETAVALEYALRRLEGLNWVTRRLRLRLASLAALFYTHAGLHDRAAMLLEEAERLADNCRDPQALITYYSNLVTHILSSEDDEQARIMRALDAARKLEDAVSGLEGLEFWESLWVQSIIAELEREAGLLEHAGRRLEALWGALRAEPDAHVNPTTYNVAVALALYYLEAEPGPRGVEKARRVIREALDMAMKLRGGGLKTLARDWLTADLALIEALTGNREVAERMFPRHRCEAPDETWKWRCRLYRVLVEGEKPEGLERWVLRLLEKYGYPA